jgi:hypothetical protein
MGPQLTSSPAAARARGHVMLLAVLVMMLLAVLGFSMVDAVSSAKDEGTASELHQQRLMLAESGLDAAFQNMRQGGSGVVGSPADPVGLGAGSFYTLAVDRGDGTVTVFSVGTVHDRNRVIRARIRRGKPVFYHAIFAGNSSGDPDYVMKFGGTGSHADQINGDVYSGGSVEIDDQADLAGEVRAQGTITGGTGDTGITQTGFDFAGVDFTSKGVVDVASDFAQNAVVQSSVAGGNAGQVAQSDPAHIFRLNPSDRTDVTGLTAKDDYFLEDPYEPMGGTSSKDDGSDNYMLNIDDGSGVTRRTYYIDGNLWVHNLKSFAFMLGTSGSDGVQVTFIVRGNITFSDSFRIQDLNKDAVGFVALKDPNVADSGNIYLGDPTYGTLKELDAYLYAENDFLDVNLDAKGSKDVRILGAMTAGNQVAIDRGDGGQHSKLTVDWDKRLQNGQASLPFLSTDMPQTSGQVVLEAWVESPIVPLDTLGSGGIAPDAPPPSPDPAVTDPPSTRPTFNWPSSGRHRWRSR